MLAHLALLTLERSSAGTRAAARSAQQNEAGQGSRQGLLFAHSCGAISIDRTRYLRCTLLALEGFSG